MRTSSKWVLPTQRVKLDSHADQDDLDMCRNCMTPFPMRWRGIRKWFERMRGKSRLEGIQDHPFLIWSSLFLISMLACNGIILFLSGRNPRGGCFFCVSSVQMRLLGKVCLSVHLSVRIGMDQCNKIELILRKLEQELCCSLPYNFLKMLRISLSTPIDAFSHLQTCVRRTEGRTDGRIEKRKETSNFLLMK